MTANINPSIPLTAEAIKSNSVQTINADEEAAFKHVRKIRGFYGHVAKYVVVIGALAIFNLIKSPDRMWVVWRIGLGFGIGISRHARIWNHAFHEC